MSIIIQQVLFAVVVVLSFGFAFRKFSEIRKNILRGKDEDISDNKGERFKNVLLISLGQKKMFQNWIPAILHLFIYVAFMITQIELVEIFIDGFFGVHRFFAPILGGFYTFLISFIEVLSVLAFVATFAFLARRNLLKVPRFHKSEMSGWPKLDGNIILYLELCLLICIFTMNTADLALQAKGVYGSTGAFLVSSQLAPFLAGMSESSLVIMERIGWWGHIMVVFAFLNYLPFSKHLHIILAFFNTYFADLGPKGKMRNMPEVANEVKMMLDPNAMAAGADAPPPPERFGAKDVEDLSWKHLLAAYSCTECGRCTAACPANGTDKLLSPRKIMMDVRDRVEEKAKNEKIHGSEHDDGKSLIHDYISQEELNACTSCNACVQECPISINPLSIITELRRHLILDEAKSPEEWNLMFSNIENNGAVWQFNPMERANWAEELKNENS